jgi:small subunit ribosomal protein S6
MREVRASMRDEIGTLREYETVYILKPDTAQEEIAQMNARVRGILEGMGGKLLDLDNWGKRKLAYEVKKQLKGIYMYWKYLAPSGVVEEVQRNLRMLDPVIRYYTVRVADNVVPDARQSAVDDARFSAAAEVRPDEEEIVTGAAEREDFDDEFGEPGLDEEV